MKCTKLTLCEGWQPAEGNALSGGTVAQVKMREGEGTEPFSSCTTLSQLSGLMLPLLAPSSATAAGDLAPFPGCLAGSVEVLSSLAGQGSPHTGCSSTSEALCGT